MAAHDCAARCDEAGDGCCKLLKGGMHRGNPTPASEFARMIRA